MANRQTNESDGRINAHPSESSAINDSEPEPSALTDPLHADLDTLGHALQRRRMFDKLFEVTADPVQLGHYDILHELGRGAMGVVYVARDTKLGRQVAIKRLQDRGDANLRERLVHEAQAMAKLNHPNVVPIYESCDGVR